MDVANNRGRGPGARSRPLAMIVLAFAGASGIARAADMDVNSRAARVKAAPEIKTMAENYFTAFARLAAASPSETVTNQALFMEHFDLKWQLTRALDEGRPLDDLSAVGLVKGKGGSIQIDLGAFPQWVPFPEKLASLMPTLDLASAGPLLVNRGFRETDIAALKSYIDTHDLKAATAAKTLPIAISFSRLVKKYDKLKLPVTKDMAFSYLYQRGKAEAEARRAWAEGLVQILDAQRARVLYSFLTEMKGTAYWIPDDADAGIADLLATMRLPDYERRAADEAKGATP